MSINKQLLVMALALSLTACAPMSNDRATRALEAQGFTEIEFHGMAIIGCGESDFFRKEFTAKGSNGVAVSGVVCGGWFKGATVRLD